MRCTKKIRVVKTEALEHGWKEMTLRDGRAYMVSPSGSARGLRRYIKQHDKWLSSIAAKSQYQQNRRAEAATQSEARTLAEEWLETVAWREDDELDREWAYAVFITTVRAEEFTDFYRRIAREIEKIKKEIQRSDRTIAAPPEG